MDGAEDEDADAAAAASAGSSKLHVLKKLSQAPSSASRAAASTPEPRKTSTLRISTAIPAPLSPPTASPSPSPAADQMRRNIVLFGHLFLLLPNNVFLLIILLLLQDPPGFLSAQLVPMILASGLEVTFPDAKSKSARNNLIVKVIKGANVLNLREDIDAYPSRFPDAMAGLDKNLLGAHLQASQVILWL